MRNVLVIEKDRDFRESVKENVKLLGYNITAVKGSKEAENVLRYKKQVDLVIINYETLGMSGQDLANWVLQNCSKSGSQVIFTHSPENFVCAATLIMADEVIDKSTLIKELPAILNRRIGHPDPLSYSTPQNRSEPSPKDSLPLKPGGRAFGIRQKKRFGEKHHSR